MEDFLYYLIVFITTIIAVSVLGLIAGFSPTLYITQITVAAKSEKRIGYTIALSSGVLAAIILLIILFQTIHLDTLVVFIDKTVRAITVSVIFNVLVGAAFIYGGIWYLRHQELPKPKPTKLKSLGGFAGIFGFGFIRTFISVTGVTATYIAGNIISSVSVGIVERIVYTLIFLATTIIPFVAIIILMKRNPHRLEALTAKLVDMLHKVNYRLVVGVAAVIFGGAIIFFNVMMALFY